MLPKREVARRFVDKRNSGYTTTKENNSSAHETGTEADSSVYRLVGRKLKGIYQPQVKPS